MVLRVLKDCFLLTAVRIEIGIRGVDAVPVVAVQDAVVVGRRIIVAETHASSVPSCDVPPLRVVVALRLVKIVGHPRSQVVVADVEELCHAVLAANHAEQGVADVLVERLEQGIVMGVQVANLADLSRKEFVEGVLLQQGITDVRQSRSGEVGSHLVQVVDVCLQVLLRKVLRCRGEVVNHTLEVHIADFGEFEDGGNLFVDFQKLDVGK